MSIALVLAVIAGLVRLGMIFPLNTMTSIWQNLLSIKASNLSVHVNSAQLGLPQSLRHFLLTKLQPEPFGKRNVYLSEEIDVILYKEDNA